MRRMELGRFQKINRVYSTNKFKAYKCVFVHIPKTAGISINMSLFGNLGGGHSSTNEYKILLGIDNFNDYFKFAFVRNPYSRLLSAYYFLKRGGFNHKDKNWAEEHLKEYNNFEDFVLNWVNKDSIHSYVHFKPQYKYICNRQMEIEVDFIGRFENIKEDYQKICNRLEINRPLKKLNSTEYGDHWKDFYNSETSKIVESVYWQDFQMFNYSITI